MNEHELGFTTFLAEPLQRRMRTLLELGPKKREKVRNLLYHSVTLDLRFAQTLRVGVKDVLLQHGAAETCFVISSAKVLDGREMPLDEALARIGPAKPEAGFISCIPGKLGFFADEDGQDCNLLKK